MAVARLKRMLSQLTIIAWFIILLHGMTFTTASSSTVGRRLADADHKDSFISIDCGENEGYTDENTTIYYSADSPYTDAGVSMPISPQYKPNLKVFNNVRSFPNGTRNCYTLRPKAGKENTNYLIRAYFMYGNYDGLDKIPKFDLHLGVDLWDTVLLLTSFSEALVEMIHTISTSYLQVCLVDTGNGTPFISGLELRQLNDSIYVRESGSLQARMRYYFASKLRQVIRYPDDMLDRIWGSSPPEPTASQLIDTPFEVHTSQSEYKLPPKIMKMACISRNLSLPITIDLQGSYLNPDGNYYVYLHVAELQNLSSHQIREFTATANDVLIFGPYIPVYLTPQTFFNKKPIIGGPLISLQSTSRATLPPILNAFELFEVKNLQQHFTDQLEVDALENIKSFYKLEKNWQGDPCNPKLFAWDGVGCNYDNSTVVRIISLNLSSSGLIGGITPAVANLSLLKSLDLSNNSLSGHIPEFLAKLTRLKTLNLTRNNFIGPIPQLLLEKSKQGSLSLSIGNSSSICLSTSCSLAEEKKKNNNKTLVASTIASAVALTLIFAVIISIIGYARRRKLKAIKCQDKTPNQETDYRKRKVGLAKFTYSQVKKMTKGFQRELGKGGFAVVYYGCLQDGTEVAVKILSPTINASEQFSTEVELLMDIRHKNLVPLFGYCKEGNNLALIYEYMASGNLQTFLSDASLNSLSWKRRLQIAIDAGQGLEYLHYGCRPAIVHRDVKSPNILLNKNLQAKIADFGYSKMFPDEDKTHVSTRIIGTLGYLDPQYHETRQLNEKSDVYSFGIVLLELITGKDAIVNRWDQTDLIQWIMPMVENGDIWSIIDNRMQPIQNINSVWRVTDLALMCVKPTSVERPTMSQVVAELKECLAIETDATNSIREVDGSHEMNLIIPSSGLVPDVR